MDYRQGVDSGATVVGGGVWVSFLQSTTNNHDQITSILETRILRE